METISALIFGIAFLGSALALAATKQAQPKHLPEFEKFIVKFHSAARLHSKNKDDVSASALNAIRFQYETLPGETIAQCMVKGSSQVISIDRVKWELCTDIEREIVIFHELGHCILGRRDHDETMITRGPVTMKKSLMASGTQGEIDPTHYLNYRPEYHRELFQGATETISIIHGEIPTPTYEMTEEE